MKRLIVAAALCAASPAYGQSALEYAAAGMGTVRANPGTSKAPHKGVMRFPSISFKNSNVATTDAAS